MRQIKFRGKPKNGYGFDPDKWVYGGIYKLGNNYFIVKESKRTIEGCTYNEPINIPIISNTVGQFTGLTDKNGKEIYEGDILDDGRGDIGIVIWVDAIAQFSVQLGSELFMLNEGKPNRKIQLQYTEIIDNIHDNPSLLNQ